MQSFRRCKQIQSFVLCIIVIPSYFTYCIVQQSLIGCSGLVTLVTRTPCSNAFILDQVFTALPKGSQADAAKLSKDELLIYADYILGRKALVTDVKVS